VATAARQRANRRRDRAVPRRCALERDQGDRRVDRDRPDSSLRPVL